MDISVHQKRRKKNKIIAHKPLQDGTAVVKSSRFAELWHKCFQVQIVTEKSTRCRIINFKFTEIIFTPVYHISTTLQQRLKCDKV
jgi:hypothetical protein